MDVFATGEKYWKLEAESVAPGYPRSIRADWEGLPGNIDAAFTWTNGRTYFFKVFLTPVCPINAIHSRNSKNVKHLTKQKGSRYWRYTNFQLDADYPKDLSEGFAGVPANIDTALVWSGNGKIYFFKGKHRRNFLFIFSTLLIDKKLDFCNRKPILAVRPTSEAAHQVYVPERHLQLGRSTQLVGRRIPVH